jgi:hypothetical protein
MSQIRAGIVQGAESVSTDPDPLNPKHSNGKGLPVEKFPPSLRTGASTSRRAIR